MPSIRLRAFAAGLLLVVGITCAHAEDEPRFLDVVVNDRDTKFVAELVDRDGELLAKASDFASMGLVVPSQVPEDGLISLGRVRGFAWRVDEQTQMLYLRVPIEALVSQSFDAHGAMYAGNANSGEPTADWGAILNYDTSALVVGGRRYVSGYIDTNAFGPYGSLDNQMIVRGGAYPQDKVQRLNSTYNWADPSEGRRVRIGDFVTSGLSWTRPVRLGGLQISTDFSLRPDLVSFPSTNLTGVAAVPSTVDIIVNGITQFRQDVDQGPFVINRLPVTTGAGQVQVVTRDALGRESTETLSVYSSTALLAEGLTAWSIQNGALREFYGLPGDRYSFNSTITTFRGGLTNEQTVELHGEAAQGLTLAGADLTSRIAQFGVASLAMAYSSFDHHDGYQASAWFEHNSTEFDFSTQITKALQQYCDTACKAGDPVPRETARVSIGTSVTPRNYVAASYTALRQTGRVATFFSSVPTFNGTQTVTTPAVSHASIASLSWTLSSGNGWSLLATILKDFKTSQSASGFLSLSIPIDERHYAGATATRGGDGADTIDAQAGQTASMVGDLGWRVQASAGSYSRQIGEVEYRTPVGRVYGGVDRLAGQAATRAGMSGAVVVLDGSAFATQTVTDAFAIVDTDGQAGVRVYQENRPVGRTDDSGRLLLPQLASYRENKISIEPLDLPVDRYAPALMHPIVPSERSGVIASFTITRGNQALVTFVDETGTPLELGSTITQATGEVNTVGYDGQAYLMNLSADNPVGGRTTKGRCKARFAFVPVPDDLPSIGPIVCKAAK